MRKVWSFYYNLLGHAAQTFGREGKHAELSVWTVCSRRSLPNIEDEEKYDKDENCLSSVRRVPSLCSSPQRLM